MTGHQLTISPMCHVHVSIFAYVSRPCVNFRLCVLSVCQFDWHTWPTTDMTCGPIKLTYRTHHMHDMWATKLTRGTHNQDDMRDPQQMCHAGTPNLHAGPTTNLTGGTHHRPDMWTQPSLPCGTHHRLIGGNHLGPDMWTPLPWRAGLDCQAEINAKINRHHMGIEPKTSLRSKQLAATSLTTSSCYVATDMSFLNTITYWAKAHSENV